MPVLAPPEPSVLAGLTEWGVGVEQPVWAQVADVLGDGELMDITLIANTAKADMVEASLAAGLRGVAKTRINLAYNTAREKLSLPAADLRAEVPVRASTVTLGATLAPEGAGTATSPDAPGGPSGVVRRTLKAQHHWDPTVRVEVFPLSPDALAKMTGCIDKPIAEAYRDHFASMTRSFPGADAWALCVEADWTFRYEFAPYERDRQAAALSL
ncbi:unnamed protein product [Prorocentrum cordatum]|uniref:Uncharacterized protein n=1 Tax=Prorocentrum cordatum TaxID=2364126 RepID=A0ABN9WXH5_9DINO|nr:unnamed protein product [Polarella glacialis]